MAPALPPCISAPTKQASELIREQKRYWKWDITTDRQPAVSGVARQIPSTEAHNNMGHVERCSSSTELKTRLGKIMGRGKIDPENDPFGEAAQIWNNPCWSGPRDCIKTSAHRVTEPCGLEGAPWGVSHPSPCPKHPAES